MLQQLQQCDLQGKVIINHSTNTPEFAMAAVAQMRGKGCEYLAAPVWGRWDRTALMHTLCGPNCCSKLFAKQQGSQHDPSQAVVSLLLLQVQPEAAL
jgi:hypothetical protein